MFVANATGHSTAWLATWPGVGRARAYCLELFVLFVSVRVIYWAWVDKGRGAIVFKEFEQSTEVRRRWRGVAFWTYIVMTIGIPVSEAVIFRKH